MNNPAVLIVGHDRYIIEYNGKKGKNIMCGYELQRGIIYPTVKNPRHGRITTSLRELERADKNGCPEAELHEYLGKYLIIVC